MERKEKEVIGVDEHGLIKREKKERKGGERRKRRRPPRSRRQSLSTQVLDNDYAFQGRRVV